MTPFEFAAALLVLATILGTQLEASPMDLQIDRDELVELTRRLIQFRSINPPGDVREITDSIEQLLRGVGAGASPDHPGSPEAQPDGDPGAGGLRMGLVNMVVPQAELMAETRRWCDRLLEMSPTGLRIAKTSLNYRSDLHYPGVWHAREMLAMVAGTAEFAEGVDSDREGGRRAG